MAEQDIQRKIKNDFTRIGCKVTKYNANGYGEGGHSDLIIGIPPVVSSLPYPIVFYPEVKTKTGRLSLIQQIWHREMQAKGQWTCVIRGTEDAVNFLLEKGVDLRHLF